jgi:hypothetical protein
MSAGKSGATSKRPNERSISRCPDALVKRGQQHFAPATLKDLGVGDNIADQTIAVTHGACASAVHALTGFLSLRGGRIALGVDSLLRGIGFNDQTPKIVGRLTRNENEQHWAVVAGGARGVQYIFLRA